MAFLHSLAVYALHSGYIYMEHDHLLSTYLLSASLAIPSFAIRTFAITFICYQASFAIQPQLLSTYLLSSLTCYQANQQFCYQSSFAIKFSTCSRSLFNQFFPLKIRKKCLKILEFFILWRTLRGHGTGSFCTYLLKDSNNSICIFTKKT